MFRLQDFRTLGFGGLVVKGSRGRGTMVQDFRGLRTGFRVQGFSCLGILVEECFDCSAV